MIRRWAASAAVTLAIAGPVAAQDPGPEAPLLVPTDPAVAGPTGTAWASADYLLWTFKKMNVPPLVTTGSAADLIPAALGQPGTSVLLGGGIPSGEHSGGSLMAGLWLDNEADWGVEAGGFFFPSRSSNFAASSSQYPVLGRPFYDTALPGENSELTAFPGLSTGTITVNAATEFWGVEANILRTIWATTPCDGISYRVQALVGFRYLNLHDSLGMQENINVNADLAAFPGLGGLAGDHITTFDQFDARNQFAGGQLGGDLQMSWGRFDLDVRGVVGLGNNHEGIQINGGQRITPPGGPTQFYEGDLFAVATNIGHSSEDRFSVVPEVSANIGYRITDHIDIHAGYSFLYWTQVARAGDQVDRVVNSNLVPNFTPGALPVGAARPVVPFAQSDFWAQGVNLGLGIHW